MRKHSCVPIYSYTFRYITSILVAAWSCRICGRDFGWWVDDLVIGFTKCHPAALTLKGRMHLRDDRLYNYMTLYDCTYDQISPGANKTNLWLIMHLAHFSRNNTRFFANFKERGWTMQQPLVAGLKHLYLCLNLSQRLSLTDSTKWQRHASFLRSIVSIHMFSWMSLWSSCDLMWQIV